MPPRPKKPNAPNGTTPNGATPNASASRRKNKTQPAVNYAAAAKALGAMGADQASAVRGHMRSIGGLDDADILKITSDPALLDEYVARFAQAPDMTNVDPDTPRTDSIDPAYAGAMVSQTMTALQNAGVPLKGVKLNIGGVNVGAGFRQPGQAVDAAAEAAPAQAKAGGRRGKSAAEPKPGSREWAEKQDEKKKKEYYDKGQNPPATVGLESALGRNWPTIARVGGLALGGATIGAGIAGANYLMGRGGPAAPAQPNAADAEARAEARRMRMEELRIPQANPAGTMDVPPTKLDRILKSRSQ